MELAEWLAGVIRTLDHVSRPDDAMKGAAGETPELKTRTNEGTGEPSRRSTQEFAWTRPRTCRRPSIVTLWPSWGGQAGHRPPGGLSRSSRLPYGHVVIASIAEAELFRDDGR